MEERYYIKEVTYNKYININSNNTKLCEVEDASYWFSYIDCINILEQMVKENFSGLFKIEKIYHLK